MSSLHFQLEVYLLFYYYIYYFIIILTISSSYFQLEMLCFCIVEHIESTTSPAVQVPSENTFYTETHISIAQWSTCACGAGAKRERTHSIA